MKTGIRRAFTLIELLLAILIICFLALIVYVRFGASSSPPAPIPASAPTNTVVHTQVVVQTEGNNKLTIISPALIKIDGKPCLVTISSKKGEEPNGEDVVIWYPGAKAGIPKTEKEFQEFVFGKPVTPLNTSSPECKELQAVLDKIEHK